MSEVDPDDDTVDRYVVEHHRYDAERHERRNVVVAAYDDEVEFRQRIDAAASELRRRQADGTAEPQERITGGFREAGYVARSRATRAAVRAVRRAPRGPRHLITYAGERGVHAAALLEPSGVNPIFAARTGWPDYSRRPSRAAPDCVRELPAVRCCRNPRPR